MFCRSGGNESAIRETVDATSVVWMRREDQVAGFRRAERDAHRFRIAHLADDDDVRRLTDRGAQCGRKVRRIDPHLDLLDETATVLVLVLDRIFDRDDVARVPPVDLLDQGGQRRRLARTRRPTDEDQPTRELRQQLDCRRQAKRRQARDPRRQQAHRRRGPAPLAVQVDAEAADAADAKRRVRDPCLAILPPCVRRERRQDRLLDVEPIERPFGERDDLAVDANRGRRAGHEQEVAAVAGGQQPQPPFKPAAVPHRRRQARLDSRMQLENEALDVVGVGHEGMISRVTGSVGSRL